MGVLLVVREKSVASLNPAAKVALQRRPALLREMVMALLRLRQKERRLQRLDSLNLGVLFSVSVVQRLKLASSQESSDLKPLSKLRQVLRVRTPPLTKVSGRVPKEALRLLCWMATLPFLLGQTQTPVAALMPRVMFSLLILTRPLMLPFHPWRGRGWRFPLH